MGTDLWHRTLTWGRNTLQKLLDSSLLPLTGRVVKLESSHDSTVGISAEGQGKGKQGLIWKVYVPLAPL